MAYLNYTASLRPKRNGNGAINNGSIPMVEGMICNGSSTTNATNTAATTTTSNNGGGWLSNNSHGSYKQHYMVPMNHSMSAVSAADYNTTNDGGGMAAMMPSMSATASCSSSMIIPGMVMSNPASTYLSSNMAASITAAAAFMGHHAFTLCMHAGASIFINPNESIQTELESIICDLQIILGRCTDSVLSNTIKSAKSENNDDSINIDTLFGALYLWLHPKIIDQRTVRTELALKEPIQRNSDFSLIEQITQIIVELRNIKKLPAAMILSLGVIGLNNGNCAIVLMVNKTLNHPLYILPGVSPKSIESTSGTLGGSKRKRSTIAAIANGGADNGDDWLDDWLLVQDRAGHRFKSDIVFVHRGSFASATIARSESHQDNSGEQECTIQPTQNVAITLATMNLDIVGRPWKGLAPTGSGPLDSTCSSSIVYHFKRTVSLDDLRSDAVIAATGSSTFRDQKTLSSVATEFPDLAIPESPNKGNNLQQSTDTLNLLQSWISSSSAGSNPLASMFQSLSTSGVNSTTGFSAPSDSQKYKLSHTGLYPPDLSLLPVSGSSSLPRSISLNDNMVSSLMAGPPVIDPNTSEAHLL